MTARSEPALLQDPEQEDATSQEVKGGGPGVCPKPCSECADGWHHWMEAFPMESEDEDINPERDAHEAHTVHGLDTWLECKHCDAWTEGPFDDASGADGGGAS